MKKFSVRDITLIGVMAALVFAASNLQIIIPIALGTPPRLHLGNVTCILGGIVLGGIPGGLAAGIGSAFYDITNPIYITSAPFTFAFKFLMGFICGIIAYSGNKKGLSFWRNTTGAAFGIIIYIFLYLTKTFITDIFFLNMELPAALIRIAEKGGYSTINGIIAVIAAVPLGITIKKTLDAIPRTRF